jgi:hypothetical protein
LANGRKKISSGAGQNAAKVAQFILHVSGGADGVGHLTLNTIEQELPQNFPEEIHISVKAVLTSRLRNI